MSFLLGANGSELRRNRASRYPLLWRSLANTVGLFDLWESQAFAIAVTIGASWLWKGLLSSNLTAL